MTDSTIGIAKKHRKKKRRKVAMKWKPNLDSLFFVFVRKST